MQSLKARTAIVTGAASGIGAATAQLLAERGASVVLADIDGNKATTVADAIERTGGRAIAHRADVADEEQVRSMVQKAVDTFGGLDILHNNAALITAETHAADGPIADLDADLFVRVLRVNLIGYALGAKHAIPHMVARGGGVIVNTGSMSGILADVTRSMYGITKTAIMGLTNTIATQYGRQGIRCVTIAPGLVLTPASAAVMSPEEIAHHARQSPLNRGAEPSDVAELVAFLASDGGAYISGETIRLDGGMGAHLPSFADDIDVA